jgi:hypothetical protein
MPLIFSNIGVARYGRRPKECEIASNTTLLKGREMRRTDLFEVTMQGWARLNPEQRERFFQAGLKAALRLEQREFREWLRRRVSEPPLAAPVDQASFAISKGDIARLMRSARENKSPQRNSGN